MKKILKTTLILTIFIMMIAVNMPAVFAATFQTRINGSTNGSLNIYAENTFTITLSMSDASNVYGIEANLSYSSTYFTLVSATNEFQGGDPLTVGSKVVVSTTSPKSGTFNYAKLTFKAKPAFLASTTPQAIIISNVLVTYDMTKETAGLGSRITVDVVVPKSTNNNLSSLSVDGKSVPSFSSSDTSYDLGSTDAESISIAATPSDSKATVSGTGRKTLKYGSNKFDVVVTAESGAKKTYSVSISKNDYRSTNNNLESLSIEGYNLIFDKERLSYTLIVDNAVTSVNINAVAEDDKAKVTGTGTKSLKIYSNVFNIVVTAENTVTKTYSVNVVRRDVAGIAGDLSRDNILKSLSVKDYPFDFNPEQTDYAIDVENWIETIEISVELNDPKASVMIDMVDELIIGPNEVLIKVYSESEDERIYKIIVNRQGDNPIIAVERIIDLLPKVVADRVELISSDPKGLTKDIWNTLVVSNKQYVFSVKNGSNDTLYQWHFAGSKVADSDWIDFEVNLNSSKRDEIRKLLNYREAVIIDLVHSGAIADGIILGVNVASQYSEGSKLYLYYYDEVNGKLVDQSAEAVVKDGFVQLDLDHASSYVLTPVKLSLFDSSSVFVLGAVALLISLMVLWVIMLSYKVRALKRRLIKRNENAV